MSLSGVLLSQRENARRERCDLNLARLYAATVEYCDANGSYPPAFTTDASGKKLHSWRVLLLPFLGEESLYSQIRLDEPWDSEWNRKFWTQTPSIYRCASTPIDENDSDSKSRRCAYSCVVGASTVFPSDGSCVTPELLLDGASNTILYVERKNAINWMDPNADLPIERVLEENAKPSRERVDFGSWHGRGEYVLFCDGARRFLSESIDDNVLTLLLGVDDSRTIEQKEPAESTDGDMAEDETENEGEESSTTIDE